MGAKEKNPRAIVLGYGSSSDAHHLTAPHPKGEGLKRALTEALNISNASTDDIAFVNAHGTGTFDNDRVESKVLKELLPGVPFLSTKGYTGHTLGAAGAIEASFTVACLERSTIPRNIGFACPDPELSVTPVVTQTPIKGSIAISQSLAFGGCNGVTVFGNGRGSCMEALVQGIGIVGGFGTGIKTFSQALSSGLSKTQAVTVKTPEGSRKCLPICRHVQSRSVCQEKNPQEDGPFFENGPPWSYLALEDARKLSILTGVV